jgi:thiamine-monophosphate kinase
MKLNEIGEFGLIKRIQKRPFAKSPQVIVGIGDDAAAVLPTPGKSLLLTTDILVERVHFDLAFSTFFQVGYKAVSVNVSDIAAMGGRPLYFLVSLGLSGKEFLADIDQLYRGMEQASRKMPLGLIGGNIAASRTRFFVSITLIGEASKSRLVTRGGGRPGDLLYVTGTLGDAAAGLEILRQKDKVSSFGTLIRRHQVPKARWKEGLLLAEEKIPSAMIDVSDGLSSDLTHLAHQSGVGAEIELSHIPISPSLKRYARSIGADPIPYALHGGEDYELLFSVPPKKANQMDVLIQDKTISARCIGSLVRKEKGLLVKDRKGMTYPIEAGGYDHLNRRSK